MGLSTMWTCPPLRKNVPEPGKCSRVHHAACCPGDHEEPVLSVRANSGESQGNCHTNPGHHCPMHSLLQGHTPLQHTSSTSWEAILWIVNSSMSHPERFHTGMCVHIYRMATT
jgi:hypothetical protein